MKLSTIPTLAAFVIPALAVPTSIATTPSTSLPPATTVATTTTRIAELDCFNCNTGMGIDATTTTTTSLQRLVTRAMPHEVVTRYPIPSPPSEPEAQRNRHRKPWEWVPPIHTLAAKDHLEQSITQKEELTTEGQPVVPSQPDSKDLAPHDVFRFRQLEDGIVVMEGSPDINAEAASNDNKPFSGAEALSKIEKAYSVFHPKTASATLEHANDNGRTSSIIPRPTLAPHDKYSRCQPGNGIWEVYLSPEGRSRYKKACSRFHTKPTTPTAPVLRIPLPFPRHPSYAAPSYTNLTSLPTLAPRPTAPPAVTPKANCTTTVNFFPTLNMGASTTYSSTTTSTRMVECSGCALRVYDMQMGHGPGPVVLGGKPVVQGTGVKTEVVAACRPTGLAG